MARIRKSTIPTRAKLCTLLSGILIIATLSFAVYASFPNSAIPDKDNPLWGTLVGVIMVLTYLLLLWGWKGIPKKSK